MKPKTITLLVVLALFAFILYQNSDPASIELLFWTIPIPRFILIFSSLFLGWVVGWFTHLAYAKGKQKSKADKAAKIDDIEQGRTVHDTPETDKSAT